jgi:hypothetical protein
MRIQRRHTLTHGAAFPKADAGDGLLVADQRPLRRRVEMKYCTAIAPVTQTQYTFFMKSAVIPQIRVEPELRAELESVLKQGETLTDFVEATVRNAIAFRRVQTSFHERAQAASKEYHRTGVSVPVEVVLERLQSKLDAKRKKLGR